MIDKNIQPDYSTKEEKLRLHAALPLLAPAIATAIGAAIGLTGTGLVLQKKIQNYFANNPGALDSIISKFGTKPGDQPEVEEELKELSKPVGGKIETWEGSYADTGTKVPEKLPEPKGIEVPPQEKVSPPGFQKAEPLNTDILANIYKGHKGLQVGRIQEDLIKKYRKEGMDFIDAVTKGTKEGAEIVDQKKLKIIEDKMSEVSIGSDGYVDLIDEHIRIVEPDFHKDLKRWKDTRPDLAEKTRAQFFPDWAEARYGKDYQGVLQKQQAGALKQKSEEIDNMYPDTDKDIGPSFVGEQQMVDEIDEMNKANIDELLEGRKKNATGGRIDKPLTGRSRDI